MSTENFGGTKKDKKKQINWNENVIEQDTSLVIVL